MTKRKTPAKTSQNATKQLSESVESKSSTTVTPKTKASTKPSQKGSEKPRGRPKKVVEKPVPTETIEIVIPAPVSKVVDVDSRTISYQSAGNTITSKWEQFKAWLVYKLYVVTSFFRGY